MYEPISNVVVIGGWLRHHRGMDDEREEMITGDNFEPLYPYIPRQFGEQQKRRFVRLCVPHMLRLLVPGRPSPDQVFWADGAARLIFPAFKGFAEDTAKSRVEARGHWEAASREIDKIRRSARQSPPAAVKTGIPVIRSSTEPASVPVEPELPGLTEIA